MTTALPPLPRLPRLPPVIWAVLLGCLLPEALLLGADLGLWGSASWRPLAYQNGAFWAGLLHGWRPNYAAQPVVMFASYGWLHAGPAHLLGNLAALVWLGPPAVARIGARGFVILWAASLLGGGLAFGLLTRSPAPMVGASGALFGLAGAWIVAEARRMPEARARRRRGLGLLLAILTLNAAAWALRGGHLAWETHLGGLAVGMVFEGLWRGEIRPS